MLVNKKFAKYVSQNILGMLGISLYILADTFFISLSEGANGIAALNLVLPVYSVIYAFGAMIGVGSAIRFAVLRARKEKNAEFFFANAIIWAFIFSVPFMVIGGIFPGKLIQLLGGDGTMLAVGVPYTRIFMLFAPFFMWNQICNAFVRNDGNPTLAMIATLSGSLFNTVMDYVLMFPLNMGMAGAALATAFSPVVGILICLLHFFSKKNSIKVRVAGLSFRRLCESCQLGVSAFVGEMSSGVITMVFNFLLLGIAGNIGVAAYGVIANIALVGTSVFNGVSQGAQPLLSEYYGKQELQSVRHVLKLGITTALLLAIGIYAIIFVGAEGIVGIFNSEQNMTLAIYAQEGLKLYFIGFLFAGLNIIGTGYLSAVETVSWAFAASVMRGFVAIVVCAFALSFLFGMTGVWLAFPVAEALTAVVTWLGIKRSHRRLYTFSEN